MPESEEGDALSETNPYAPPAHEDDAATHSASREPQSLLGAMGQGVRLGLKWMTFIMGPLAALGFVAALAGTFYRLVWVEGLTLLSDPRLRWETLKTVANPFGFYLVCCLWGIVAGELVCPITYLVRRAKRRHVNA
jgi:hypothetical protein